MASRIILFCIITTTFFLPGTAAGSESIAADLPGAKPVLPYLLSVPGMTDGLAEELGLTAREAGRIKAIVSEEARRLAELKISSDTFLTSIAADRGVGGMAPTRLHIALEAARFNRDADFLERTARDGIARTLGDRAAGFDVWLAERWREESAAHDINSFDVEPQAYGRRVYATQYFAHSDYEAAVPDKFIKFANLGWEPEPFPPGYEGSDYRVNLERDGTTVNGVKILDVGPWNIDDNYWNSAGAAVRPRRLFRDLPQGMPESQAAFFDNYNGGKDQSGRQVLNPAGIDLTPAVAQDLGLGYLENGWINVTYNWEAGQFDRIKIIVSGYSSKHSKTTSFQVKWTGADPSFTAGLSSYDVQYRPPGTSAWTNWKKKTTVTAGSFPGIAGRTYYFRARARATDGAVGSWSPTRRTIVPYDQDRFYRKAGFDNHFRAPSSSYYLATTRYSIAKGDVIIYKFSGRAAALISTLGPNRSKAKIYLDGRHVKTIDNYAPKTRARRPVFWRSWSETGVHVLKVVNLATPGRPRFDVDGLAVGR